MMQNPSAATDQQDKQSGQNPAPAIFLVRSGWSLSITGRRFESNAMDGFCDRLR
jgi:hypothetical protein